MKKITVLILFILLINSSLVCAYELATEISNNDGKASTQEMLELLADSISESYSIDRNDISLNDPFHGGHITRTYGNNPVPWIQVEMNRDLYLSKEWFDYETLEVDNKRLSALNQMFENTLTKFCRDGFKEG